MFALLEIARIYKALFKLFADLQGPICYKDLQNKGLNLIIWKPLNFSHWAFVILVKLSSATRSTAHYM